MCTAWQGKAGKLLHHDSWLAIQSNYPANFDASLAKVILQRLCKGNLFCILLGGCWGCILKGAVNLSGALLNRLLDPFQAFFNSSNNRWWKLQRT